MADLSVDELIVEHSAAALPLWLVAGHALEGWLERQPASIARWVRAAEFRGEQGRVLVLPGEGGAPAGALLGLGAVERGQMAGPGGLGLWHTAALAGKLPASDFQLEPADADRLSAAVATQAALGFVYGEYRFDRYCSPDGEQRRPARLVAPSDCDLAYVRRAATGLALARDLINTPAGDMGPAELAGQAEALAARHGGEFRCIEGEDLLEQGYPAIHAVGRASSRAPRLLDLRWGNPDDPRVTLVGKGVCFDTGGLDLKPAASMLMMKKDMGGAACVLGLAHMVMDANLPVSLRLLVPAVENSVSGNAFRPGDVLSTRKGLTVEVGNTDAEGRLVLCDALAEADREQPALIVDMATLTGAARIALGPELPALYGNCPEWVDALVRHGRGQHDPLWPMPLWQPYGEDLASKVADTNNVSASAFAGSIVAALFLQRFVAPDTPWLHMDLFAWNMKDRPGRPAGAEAQCIRAVYALLEERFEAK